MQLLSLKLHRRHALLVLLPRPLRGGVVVERLEALAQQRALQRSPLPLDGRPACQLARAWRKRSCLLLCGGAVLQHA